jgi:hypothetical protein
MIPKERGLERISVYFIFLFTNFCFNGEYQLHELLRVRPCGSLISRNI